MHLVLANAEPLWPLAIYIALVVVTAGGMVALSYVLWQRHRDRATGQPYESGIAVADDSARRPVAVHYYRVAILFVIFDLEAQPGRSVQGLDHPVIDLASTPRMK